MSSTNKESATAESTTLTSEQAMEQARNSMSDEALAKFRMTRIEWVEGINRLEQIGIYPDNDPRTPGAQAEYEKQKAQENAKDCGAGI